MKRNSSYRRRRSSRRRRMKKIDAWLSRNGLDLFGICFFLLALVLLLVPFHTLLSENQLESRLVKWLVFEQGTPSLGGAFLVVAVLVGVVRVRMRINGRQQWWARQCPTCQGTHLSRIHRTWPDRLLGKTGIPVRRYVCRDCGWRGLRIDESRIHY